MYPEITDPDFYDRLYRKAEIYETLRGNSNEHTLLPQQRFVSSFLNKNTPYESLLLFHNLGSGKTCSAITIAEHFIRKTKRKVIVLVKNKTIENNFKKELLSNFCTGSVYISPEEKAYSENPENVESDLYKDIKKRYTRLIRKNYKFYHFKEFEQLVHGYISPTTGTLDSIIADEEEKVIREKVGTNRLTTISNSLLIIDEPQNIIGNNQYIAVKKLLDKSYNVKVLLLSATPVFDNVTEIFEISNLLLPSPNFPIRDDLVKEGLVSKRGKGDSAVISLTERGIRVLRNSLIGKVSYVPKNESLFPEKLDRIGDPNISPGFYLIPCPFQSYQEKAYRAAKKKSHKVLDGISNIALPAPFSTFVKKKSENKLIETKDDRFLATSDMFQHDRIREYSSKIYELVLNVSNAVRKKQKCFVYSNLVDRGVYPVVFALRSVGFRNHHGPSSSPRYGIIEGNTREPDRLKIINMFNRNQIDVIIGTETIAEGVSLMETRQIHILDPPWNPSKLNQIIGRGIRTNSHKNLPAVDRNVSIFLYCSVFADSKEPTIDVHKYRTINQKDAAMRRVERILKEVAVDCIVKNRPGRDGSRECDYTTCNYPCYGNRKPLSPSELDRSTELDFLDMSLVYDIKDAILTLFREQPMWTFEQLISVIQLDDIKYVAYALDELIQFRETVYGSNGKKGRLIYVDNVYLFTPNDVPAKSSFFSKVSYPVQKTNGTTNEFLEEMQEDEDEENKQGYLYGYYVGEGRDRKFRIVNWIGMDPLRMNLRNVKAGKVCVSYNKAEIESFYRFLGIDFPRPPPGKSRVTTQILCGHLERVMVDLGLTNIPEEHMNIILSKKNAR